MPRSTFSGVIGSKSTRTPTASKMALAIAGIGELAVISPTPLAPNGPSSRRALEDDILEVRQVARARHQIFVEVDRPMRAVGIIGLGRLVERMAHAHPGAADDLLLDHPRIERAADLVGALQRQHRDLAGLGVDLDLGDRAGMGIAGGGRILPVSGSG